MIHETRSAKVEAQVLRHDLRITGPPNLQAVLQSLGIVLKEVNLGDGFDGAALRTPKGSGILINNAICYQSRKRFTIAHELGHLRLAWHNEFEYRCASTDIESFHPNRRHEREADEFAAEFLLPEAVIEPVFRKHPFSFDLIKTLADEYETSLTATALRGVAYTLDRCAVVYSVGKRICWGKPSRSFHYSVRVGALHENTYAADFFSGRDVPTEPVQVNPYAWLSDSRIPHDLVLFEHSIPFPRIGAVLTVLCWEPQEEDELGFDAF